MSHRQHTPGAPDAKAPASGTPDTGQAPDQNQPATQGWQSDVGALGLLGLRAVPSAEGADIGDRQAADAHTTAMLRPLASPHILVMSAQLELLDILGQLFHEEGYSVTLSSRLLDAATILRIQPDLVVIDVPLDGVVLAEELMGGARAGGPERAPAFICCTSVPGTADMLRLRGVPTLLKPFDLDDLLAMISTQGDHQRA